MHSWEVAAWENAFGKVPNIVLIGSAVWNKLIEYKIRFAYLEHALHSKSWNSTVLKVVKLYDMFNQQSNKVHTLDYSLIT